MSGLKIVFICGSLEPGRDGVGDYTRTLSAELTKQGHEVSILALNDIHITSLKEEMQYSTDIAVPVFRIPSGWKQKERFRYAKKIIADINPVWLSLQLVIYSFEPRGLPFKLSKNLAVIGEGRQWHIMFHELWVGKNVNKGPKQILYAVLQKKIIKNIASSLRPSVIHTHLPVYYSNLHHIGCNPKALPLFSNIPVSAKTPVSNNFNRMRVGVFSQAEANNDIINFLIKLQNNLQENGLILEMLLIGTEKLMQGFETLLRANNDFAGEIKYTGFLDPENLSHALQTCNIGLTTVPRHALGKSGSVSAFLTHGIPVAAPNVSLGRNPDEIGFFSTLFYPAIIKEPNYLLFKDAGIAANSVKKEITVSKIAQAFVSDLAL